MLGSSASETVMVGDDLRSDVGGAQDAGITGVLVRTGKFRPGDLEEDVKPDAVLDSVADLPAWWNNRSQ
jgi:ribonucleotide monophosphatase NagD (HAD superfamily)